MNQTQILQMFYVDAKTQLLEILGMSTTKLLDKCLEEPQCQYRGDGAESEGEEFNFNYLISTARDKNVGKETIDQCMKALQRINLGVYHRCEECECEIPRRRQQIMPQATTCVDCQTERELAKKMMKGLPFAGPRTTLTYAIR